MIGETISRYKIVDKLGEGGMGVVYKAEDTRLDRTVALKFLSAHLLENAEARERFVNEAKATATLDHPNICTIYEIDEAGGHTFLSMAYIDGLTLAEKIDERPLKLKQALEIATEIASGLAAAHQRGISHRDIKPANIMLAADGQVKIMDFGLAQLAGSTRITKTGTVVGTPSYMSPEQLQGEKTDRRTDIWAFGVVLHEMITGRTPFGGESDHAVSYAILHAEPEPLTALRSGVPIELDRIVAKCLAKNPDERYQHIEEALVDLRALGRQLPETTRTQATIRQSATPQKQSRLPWLLAAALAAALLVVGILYFRKSAPAPLPVSFQIQAPPGTQFADPESTAVSPDGRSIVFSAASGGEPPSLWLRRLDSVEAYQLPNTEQATAPFWSPDSTEVAFFVDNSLNAVELATGRVRELCSIGGPTRGNARGGAWSRQGEILIGSLDGLYRVPQAGGVPQLLTHIDPSRVENSHYSPEFLPDGQSFLYTIQSQRLEVRGVYAASLDESDVRRRVLEVPRTARYVPPSADRPGYLLWITDDQTLMAQPFDAAKLTIEGDAIPVARDIVNGASFWASDTGLLLYRAGAGSQLDRLIWYGRDGQRLGELWEPKPYRGLEFSPDGTQLAFGRADQGGVDIWLLDLASEIPTPLVTGPSRDPSGIWSPDGTKFVFWSDRSGVAQIYLTDVAGGTDVIQLTEGLVPRYPAVWNEKNGFMLLTAWPTETSGDLLAMRMDGSWEMVPVASSPQPERGSDFSPDGEWVVFASLRSGREEVYITRFTPGTPQTWQPVTRNGGGWPVWSDDGSEIFFRGPEGTIMSAGVHFDGDTVRTDTPEDLHFPDPPMPTGSGSYFTIHPDGRFLIQEPEGSGEGPGPLTAIVNWQAQLEQ